MKRIAVLVFSIFIAAGAGAQTATTPQEPLQFKEVEYNFGNVPQGKPVYHVFEVKNGSSKPVTLSNVHASCGCTTPEWSKDPIAPGATTQVKVGFNAAAEGPFEKIIFLQYNDSTEKQIRIKGSVWRGPDGAAPPNAIVQFLKQQLP